MALIKAASIEAVREAADAVEIIGARVQLRRVGARWTGRCLFHDERRRASPSAPRRRLHCFGCKAGGDLIRFVQETEGLDFVGAVEWLADRYRIELEYEEGGGATRASVVVASDCSPCSRTRRASTSGTCGNPRRASASAPTSPNAGWARMVQSVPAGALAGGDVLPRKAAGKGYARDELLDRGSTNRRGNDYFGARLLFRSPTPAAGHRLRSPAPPRRGPDRGEVRQHA